MTAIEERPDVELSCSGAPIDLNATDFETQKERLTVTEEKDYLFKAAAQANGESNVWSNGLKKHLVYKPERLRKSVQVMDNQDMLRLVGVLERNKTFTVTPNILAEMSA